MNKAILISIRPEHLVNILNGTKTLELRKSVPKDFKGWVYIYCTKGRKDVLYKYKDKYYTNHYLTFTDCVEVLNSKVVAMFWFDDYIKLDYEDTYSDEFYWRNSIISGKELEKATCLSQYDIVDYGKKKPLYAWHIKQLEIFDTPKELSEFYKTNIPYMGISGIEYALDYYGKEKVDNILKYSLKRPPQSWQYVYIKE